MRLFSMQLKDMVTGKTIIAAGGKVYVAVSGSPAKQALVDKDGGALSNPVTPNYGKIEFRVADDEVTTVDLYGVTPGGQAFQAIGITASGPNEIYVDTSRRHQVLVIPFSIDDTTAATETTTGFKTGIDKMWLPNPMVDIVSIDATETIDVGTDGGGSNDPNGFIAAASVATAGLVKGTIANGGVTLGALFIKQDSANAGDGAPEGFINAADENITLTLTAGSDTAEGYISLPYLLAA